MIPKQGEKWTDGKTTREVLWVDKIGKRFVAIGYRPNDKCREVSGSVVWNKWAENARKVEQ